MTAPYTRTLPLHADVAAQAARLDRVADLLLSQGRSDAAERLSQAAAELRDAAP
jgi:hypothetical protein